MAKRHIEVEIGSGNIFADFGLPKADELLLKSGLVIELRQLMEARGLTQAAVASLLGVSPPELANLCRGRFDEYSPEQLRGFLTTLQKPGT